MQARTSPGGLRRQRRTNRLRIFHVPGSSTASVGSAREALQALCNHGRIDIEPDNIQVIGLEQLQQAVPEYAAHCAAGANALSLPSLESLPSGAQAQIVNSLIKKHSESTSQVRIGGVGRGSECGPLLRLPFSQLLVSVCTKRTSIAPLSAPGLSAVAVAAHHTKRHQVRGTCA